jgi:hypothetical protein
MRHPAKTKIFQAKLVVNDPQARRFASPELATKHLAETEWLSSNI